MGMQFFSVANRQPSDLFYEPYPLYLDCPFYISGPSLVTTTLQTIIMHKGLLDAFGHDDYPVGAGARIGFRGPFNTQADIPPLPATIAARQANTPTFIDRIGGNINGVKEHYLPIYFGVKKVLTAPGWYNFEAWANAQTDKEGLVGMNGICKLAQDGAYDLTKMEVLVEPFV